MTVHSPWRLTALAFAATSFLVACGGGDDDVQAPEETRAQDSRAFTADATATTFAGMPAAAGDVIDMSTTAAGPACWAALATRSPMAPLEIRTLN